MESLRDLSFEETKEVNGGLTWLGLAGSMAVTLLIDIAMNPKSSIKSFNKGFEDGRK